MEQQLYFSFSRFLSQHLLKLHISIRINAYCKKKKKKNSNHKLGLIATDAFQDVKGGFLYTSSAASQWEAAFSELSPWCWRMLSPCSGSPRTNHLVWRRKIGTTSIKNKTSAECDQHVTHERCSRLVPFSVTGNNSLPKELQAYLSCSQMTDPPAKVNNTHIRV